MNFLFTHENHTWIQKLICKLKRMEELGSWKLRIYKNLHSKSDKSIKTWRVIKPFLLINEELLCQ